MSPKVKPKIVHMYIRMYLNVKGFEIDTQYTRFISDFGLLLLINGQIDRIITHEEARAAGVLQSKVPQIIG